MRRLIIAVIVLFLCTVSVSAEASDSAIYRRVENADMKIALTFDDGPHPYYTDRILGILDKYGIKATFFFVGQNIENYPEQAKHVREGGHEVGNHTYTHHRVRAMNETELAAELEKCDDLIYELGEYGTRLFRPPEGAFDEAAENIARKMDYSVILWSVDTKDWAHQSPSDIVKNVLGNVRGGDIILMHDYIGFDSPTPEALEAMLPKLLEMGYEFVTVSELMAER